MDLVQMVLGGLFGALLTGAGIYLTLGRTAMSRSDHEKECALRTAPILLQIQGVKNDVARLETKQDDSSEKLDEVILMLVRMNGGKDPRG